MRCTRKNTPQDEKGILSLNKEDDKDLTLTNKGWATDQVVFIQRYNTNL
jgi:hypothetical protein